MKESKRYNSQFSINLYADHFLLAYIKRSLSPNFFHDVFLSRFCTNKHTQTDTQTDTDTDTQTHIHKHTHRHPQTDVNIHTNTHTHTHTQTDTQTHIQT